MTGETWDAVPHEPMLGNVPLTVRTARLSYDGADRLDIARASCGPDGEPFAPSWDILLPILALRRSDARALEAAWPKYAADYTAEMRASYRRKRAAWDALLARPAVVLVCYCTDPARCHRRVLAELLAKLGAVDLGEVARAPAPQMGLAL